MPPSLDLLPRQRAPCKPASRGVTSKLLPPFGSKPSKPSNSVNKYCWKYMHRWKSIAYLRFGSWGWRRYPCLACLLLLSACLASAFCLDNILFLSVFWASLLEGVFFCPFFFTFGLIPSPRPFFLAFPLAFSPICLFFASPSCRLLLLRDLPFFGDFDKRRNLDGFEDFNVSVTDFEDLIMESM